MKKKIKLKSLKIKSFITSEYVKEINCVSAVYSVGCTTFYYPEIYV